MKGLLLLALMLGITTIGDYVHGRSFASDSERLAGYIVTQTVSRLWTMASRSCSKRQEALLDLRSEGRNREFPLIQNPATFRRTTDDRCRFRTFPAVGDGRSRCNHQRLECHRVHQDQWHEVVPQADPRGAGDGNVLRRRASGSARAAWTTTRRSSWRPFATKR